MSNSILRLNDVLQKTGLKRSSIYTFMKEGRFPQSVSLGARAIGWHEGDIQDWINGLKQKR